MEKEKEKEKKAFNPDDLDLKKEDVKGETKIAWPASIRTIDPVLPLPAGHAYAR